MKYFCNAGLISKKNAFLKIRNAEINFGTIHEAADTLPNPAELFLGSFSACI